MTRMVATALAAVLAVGCGKKAPPEAVGGAAPNASTSAGAATAGSTSAATSTSARPDAGGGGQEVRDRLKVFFSEYRDESDFNFLKAACAPKVERFVTAKNVDPATLVTSARQFFKNKRGLSYRPDVTALRVEHVGDTTVAHVPLTMIWGVHTPADWSPSYVPPPNDGDVLDPLEAGLVEHIAVVIVDVTFDASDRITRYVEGPPRHDPLRFVAEEHCLMTDDDPGVPVISVANGAVVTDLGVLYVTQETPKGPQVIRHVRLRGGGDVWVNDHRSWLVQNPAGGSSAGMAECLVPLEPSVRPLK